MWSKFVTWLKAAYAAVPNKSVVMTVPLKLALVGVCVILFLAVSLHVAHRVERAFGGEQPATLAQVSALVSTDQCERAPVKVKHAKKR